MDGLGEIGLLAYEMAGLGYADDDNASEILGKLTRMLQKNPAQGRIAIKKAGQITAQAAGGAQTPREEALTRIAQLPKGIRAALANQTVQLVDKVFFSARPLAAGTSADLIQAADTINLDPTKGYISNLNGGKMPKDAYAFIYGIRVRTGVNATLDATDFGVLAANISNGTSQLTLDKSPLMGTDGALAAFDTTGQDVPDGFIRLYNPKWVDTDKKLEFLPKWGSAAAANTNMRIDIYAVIVEKK